MRHTRFATRIPVTPRPPRRAAWLGLAMGMAWGLSGCGVISLAPTFELFKAAGTATSYTLAGMPAKAQDTVVHPHGRIDTVCIAWNPLVPQAEFVPALQAALAKAQVSSRVIDGQAPRTLCPTWLHYTARMDWGVPPWGGNAQMFVAQASLTLATPDGAVLASSHYQPNGAFELGKWAAVGDLIPPVVQALMGTPGTAGTPSPSTPNADTPPAAATATPVR